MPDGGTSNGAWSQEEYQEAVRELARDRSLLPAQRRELAGFGLRPEEIERALAPLLARQEVLAAKIARHERGQARKSHRVLPG